MHFLDNPLRICCLCIAMVIACSTTKNHAADITLANGVANPPANLTSGVPETAVADTATLVASNAFSAILLATLDAQGYTAANDWVFSFASPPLPNGLTNPVALPGNAHFHITDYSLFVNGGNTAFGETFDFTLQNPPADPVLEGATITRHWINILNMDKRYGDFGYAIAGQQGFWQVDNGDVEGTNGGTNRGAVNGAGPYYDSNSAGGFSTPYTFHDAPQFYSGIGSYLHFITIPAWDVSSGGKNYIVVGDTGIKWGFTIVPEPSTITLSALSVLVVAWSGFRSKQRRNRS